MPRRNNTKPHTPYSAGSLSHIAAKRTYISKSEAERAIKEAQKYNLDIKLYVYQSPTTGKWHLSSKQPDN